MEVQHSASLAIRRFKVVSVDPNPPVLDEIVDKSETWANKYDLESLKNLRVLDIARAAFAEFEGVGEKVQFCEGVVGSKQIGVGGKVVDTLEQIQVPDTTHLDETGLVVLVDGLHTRGSVRTDLDAIFRQDPRAVVLLDDCRHRWGPYVQAGVVDFLEQVSGIYHFQLVGDLGPGLATSNLGILYSDAVANETREVLTKLAGTFSQRLDPYGCLKGKKI